MKRLALTLTLLLVGCCSGHVDADAITPVLTPVLQRHDAYVEADPKLDALEKRTALRSAKLLRLTLEAAKE